MKLRTFFLLISCSILVCVFLFLSFQIKNVLEGAFTDMRATKLSAIQRQLEAIVESKRQYLQIFSQLTLADPNLSQETWKAFQTGNTSGVAKRLALIGKKPKFHISDIVFSNGRTAVGHTDSALSELNPARVPKNGLFTAARVDGEIALLSLHPLFHKGQRVGTLVLGANLDETLEKAISETIRSELTFELVPTGKEAQRRDSSATYFSLFEDHKNELRAKVVLNTVFMDSLYSSIRKTVTVSAAGSLVFLIVLVFILLEAGFLRRFTMTLETIDEAARGLKGGEFKRLTVGEGNILENRKLARSFNQFSTALEQYDAEVREKSRVAAEASKEAALTKLAQQVSHDIRSPLTALEMFSGTIDEIPEESRVAMRGAIARISDITNSLLKFTRNETREGTPKDEKPEPQLISNLVETLLAEKRGQYRELPEIEIGFQPATDSYGLFAPVDPGSFKRVLSNLLDNAVEAIPNEGTVEVEMASRPGSVIVRISDTGSGIPENIIHRLGERGFSHGKKRGSGLGLHYAFTQIHEWGGELLVHSSQARGSTIEICLPTAQAPEWFLPSIDLTGVSTIVVLDDDPSIHRVWKNRFKDKGIARVVSLYSADTFLRWCQMNQRLAKSTLLLVDYELIGHAHNGLDLIERSSIEGQSILVTSRYEQTEIRKRCVELGVPMIPKPLAGLVPISLEPHPPELHSGRSSYSAS